WGMGIIGTGMIGKLHARAITEISNARLVAVCDTVRERADALAAEYGAAAHTDYSEMLSRKDLDVVTIATPSGLHMEPAIAAARAGKHILCEKPIEIDVSRADRMIEAHARAGTQLGAIFPLRFDTSYEPLRDALSAGRFGKITTASAYVPWWRDEAYYRNSWRGTWKMDGGGAVMNQTIHLIDLLCHFLPPIESLQAYTATLGHDDMETEDNAVAICRFSGGALGMIHGSTASYPGRPTRLEITGTRGTAVVQSNGIAEWSFDVEIPQDAEIRRQFPLGKESAGVANPAAIATTRHRLNFIAFLEALEAGRPFAVDGREARKSIALIQSLYESARLGRPVHPAR
ncbi:MAG: Gfo/Idh/MocA family oxidoreductase, partial [Kiritimatiellia bacterium]|nr:Gfo/Idh/MocA family oxidoreductase [Kiritimatiellia bacterium]